MEPTEVEQESIAVEGEELDVASQGTPVESFETPDPLGPSRGSADPVWFPSGAVLDVASGAIGRDESHWDPNGSGVALLDTRNGEVRLAPNFSTGELAKSGATRFSPARIDPSLVCVIQALRDHIGRPVRVTSGYRSWAYNQEIYRNRNQRPTKSRHCSGQAVDITVSGLDGIEIAKAAIDAAGAGLGIGVGSDYAHIDVRGTWTVWTYLSGTEDAAARSALSRHAQASGSDTVEGFDVRRAVLRNCALSCRLRWAEHRDRIAGAVGVSKDASGADLARAVAAWQRAHELEVDGIIGPNTWAALQS